MAQAPATPPKSPSTPGRAGFIWPLLLDVVLVLVFVLIGRRSHSEGIDLAGAWKTFWPFLAGLAVAWLVTLAWRNPRRIAWPGIGIWIVTVAAGMILRVLSGQGTAVSFTVVALIVLGVFLLGWRFIARLTIKRRGPR